MVKTIVFLSILLYANAWGAEDSCSSEKRSQLANFNDLKSAVNAASKRFSVQLDSVKLREWTRHAALPCAPPFKAIYSKAGSTFTFLAVSHVPGPASLDFPELATIKKQLEIARPNSLLVEVRSGGQFPQTAFSSMASSCTKEGSFICGEGVYAAGVAGMGGTKVWGGEPSPSQLNAELAKVLDSDSLLAYTSAQVLLTLKRRGIPSESWGDSFSSELMKISPGDPQWNYDKFRQWLKKNLGVEPQLVEDSWIEPSSDKSAAALQRIAHTVDSVREPLIQKSLETVINAAIPSMAIYGVGHFYKQSPALEAAFGKPKITCLGQ